MQFCPLHSEVLHLATWLRLELTLHAVAYLLQKSTTKTETFKIIQTRPNPAKGETCCQNYSKLPGCHRPPWPRWHGALETSLLFNRQGWGWDIHGVNWYILSRIFMINSGLVCAKAKNSQASHVCLIWIKRRWRNVGTPTHHGSRSSFVLQRFHQPHLVCW